MQSSNIGEKEKIENNIAKKYYKTQQDYFFDENEYNDEESYNCPMCEESPCVCSDPF